MNANSAANNGQAAKKPLMITAAEFDAKLDAGEDISDYIDWDSGVMVEPGEISPGQKLAIEHEAGAQHRNASVPGTLELQQPLHLLLPSWAMDQLQNDANRQGIRQEELARLLILQRLDQQRTAA